MTEEDKKNQNPSEMQDENQQDVSKSADEEFGFEEFEDVENLDDFFEDEGDSGADIFEAEENTTAGDEQTLAANEPPHKKAKSAPSSSVKSIVSALAVVAIIGGGGYFALQNQGVRGFVSDLTGLQLGYEEGGIASRESGLTPRNNQTDPFAENIAMDEMRGANDIMASTEGPSIDGNDFPMPTPLGNEPSMNNADSGMDGDVPSEQAYNDNVEQDSFDFGLPQPEPIEEQNAEGVDAAAMDTDMSDFALPQPSANELSLPADAMPVDEASPQTVEDEQDAPFFEAEDTVSRDQFDEDMAETNDGGNGMPSIAMPDPVLQQPDTSVAGNSDIEAEAAGNLFDAPLPEDRQESEEAQSNSQVMMPQTNVTTAQESLAAPSPASQPAAQESPESEKQERMANAQAAQSDFFEANERYIEIMPARKPGYSVRVEHGGVPASTANQDSPRVAYSPEPTTRTSDTTSANIVKNAEDDPLLVAAERAMKLERYEAALRLYETLERMNPNYARALKGKGQALRALGRMEEARRAFQKAGEITPYDTEVEGAILSMKSEDNPRTAIHKLLTRHRQDPANANVAAQIGMAYAQMRDYSSAVIYLEKATRLEKANSVFWYNLAVAADKAGRTQDAILYYERALYVDGAYHGGRNISRPVVYDRLAELRGPVQ